MRARHIATFLLLGSFAVSGEQVAIPTVVTLPGATPIRLRLARDLAFAKSRPGDKVEFEILDDLRIDGVLLIAHGSRISADIIQAEPKSRANRGGKLGISLNSIPLLNGDKMGIRAQTVGQANEQTGGTSPTAVDMIKPAAPSVLFLFGKDEAFPEGTEITAYSNNEMKLDPGRFLVDITFTSSPQGALVNMYGTPIGRTPFTTRLATGTYTAVFTADGYSNQSRSITVGPGHSNTVNAAFPAKK